jgi:hypothetical protein
MKTLVATYILQLWILGHGSGDPRGPLPPDQEGREHPQAPGARTQGQGLEVSPDSGGVTYPSSGPLLQDQAPAATHVEVRVGDCLGARVLSVGMRMEFEDLFLALLSGLLLGVN